MNCSKRFVVEPGARVKLHKIDPGYIDPDMTEQDALAETKKLCKRLRKLQASLYCEKQRSALIVLQALDTAGKDGVINHVLGALNPMGCRVASFKKPGPEAAAHNFLWRVSIFLPEKGEVVIFNRSHYEDVLVVKVHDLVPEDRLVKRYHQLNSFEHFLTDNDTHSPQVLSAHQQGRAAAALQATARRPEAALEDQRRRLQGTRILGQVHRGLRGSPVPLQHRAGALVHHPR